MIKFILDIRKKLLNKLKESYITNKRQRNLNSILTFWNFSYFYQIFIF